MNAKPTYVVMTASGNSWQSHGPTAVEYATFKEAEKAAHDLSARYPHRVHGVYELKSVFGTEQKIVRQSVQSLPEQTKRRAPQAPHLEEVAASRAVN
jgi:hypothetical protein